MIPGFRVAGQRSQCRIFGVFGLIVHLGKEVSFKLCTHSVKRGLFPDFLCIRGVCVR